MIVTVVNLITLQSVFVLAFVRVLQVLKLLMLLRILQVVIIAVRQMIISLGASHVVNRLLDIDLRRSESLYVRVYMRIIPSWS